MVQRQGGLNQSCGAGCGLGVPDLRLDRPERAPASIGCCGGVDRTQCVEFHRVAHLRASPVGLYQLYRARVDAADGVGVSERPGLSRRSRRVDALRAAVAGGPNAADHRIDAVAVAFGVRETLQHDHAETLADHRAVGILGERPGIARGRQGLGLAEAHEHEDVVERVDATGQHHVGSAARQLQHGQMDGAQRARARRVDHAVRASEIQPVRNAAGHHVAEEPRKRILLPRDVVVGDAPDDRLCDAVSDTRLAHRPTPFRVSQSRPERDNKL